MYEARYHVNRYLRRSTRTVVVGIVGLLRYRTLAIVTTAAISSFSLADFDNHPEKDPNQPTVKADISPDDNTNTNAASESAAVSPKKPQSKKASKKTEASKHPGSKKTKKRGSPKKNNEQR